MNFDLMNVPRSVVDLPRWIRQQMNMLSDELKSVDQTDGGVSIVTGSLVVSTKLRKVTRASVSLGSGPVAGASIVAVTFAGGQLFIGVYTSALGVSVTPTSVNWVAHGITGR